MDESKFLILTKGKDKTKEIINCEFDLRRNQYIVTFSNGESYLYNCENIVYLVNPVELDPTPYRISTKTKTLDNINNIYIFKGSTEYWRIVFNNGKGYVYDRSKLIVEKTCMFKTTVKRRLEYLHELAAISNLKTEDGRVLLKDFYDKLTFVSEDSSLATYLDPETYPVREYDCDFLIFPFGGNASQFKAIKNAMSNQMSAIQGPPGTGKTQTILNIVANLLIRNKTVQIVSSNNSATKNVYEKLQSPRYALDFLVASLGKRENKEEFINNQTGKYPDLSKYKKDNEEKQMLRKCIVDLSQEVAAYFSKQTRLAEARQELSALELEMRHFLQYQNENLFDEPSGKIKKRISSMEIVQILHECEALFERKGRISIWHKIRHILLYGVFDWRFYKNDISVIISYLQSLFYSTKHSEVTREIEAIEEFIFSMDVKEKMNKLTSLSMEYLRAVLYERYMDKPERICFTKEAIQKAPYTVLREYPIIMSSTFSSRETLQNVSYDYVIMDEASQVNIATGALALSCARNAVIVGDVKQLSNIVQYEDRKRSDRIFKNYELPTGYSYSEFNFLESVCSIIPDIPQTLLREHYRCHPKIIDFCNQKFYNNELIIMTEDHNEPDVITLFCTSPGNHRRGNVSQRQVDVVVEEVLPRCAETAPTEIGIIAPYRDQVDALISAVTNNNIKVDTIHKFQGQEKDVIILTVVDDVISEFTDKPDMINVAVSRAKKKFCLVVSGNDQPTDSNIQDLIGYIEYNNFEVVNSEIYSVFDLLYQQYSKERQAFLAKHRRVSQYASENLMYGALVDMLQELSDMPFEIICHQKLRLLIRDFKKLTDEEYRYASNPNTHVDFLIYNRITKKPVLAIEVDGFNFHKKGTVQAERDKLKNSILSKYNIPLQRAATNGSGEINKIKNTLISMCQS